MHVAGNSQSGRREGRLEHRQKVSEHYGLHAFQTDSTACIFLLVHAVAEVLAAPPASRADEAVCSMETPSSDVTGAAGHDTSKLTTSINK